MDNSVSLNIVNTHLFLTFYFILIYSHSSSDKESACNRGDPSLIPGLGRSPGEGIGYPLQYSWASLGAQMVNNLTTIWETWVWSLGWEDPPEEGIATHSSILAWRISMDREAGGLQSMESQRVGHDWATKQAHGRWTVLGWFRCMAQWPGHIPVSTLPGLHPHWGCLLPCRPSLREFTL